MDTALQASGSPTDDRMLAPFLVERQAYALIERARPIGPSARVLDLSGGAGVIGRLLRQRLGRAAPFTRLGASADLFAARHIRRPEFEVSLLGLPFENDSFDLVFCQDTLHYAPDPLAALIEIQRVLAPRGRLLLSTSRSRRQQPLHDALGHVTEHHLGPLNERPHSVSDPETLHQLLSEAGFTDIQLEIVMITESFRSLPVHVEGQSGLDLVQNDDPSRERRLAAVEANSDHVVESVPTEGGYVASSSANVVLARARV
jgi:ubiquinone/menaquinone biosynthesis C-methylase UbiE